MSVLLSGLLHIYGPPGSGKTFAALTACDDPNKLIFLDGGASKSKDIVQGLGVKHYHDLTALGVGKTEVQYHQEMLKLIKKLPDNMELLILDTPAEFFKSGHSYVAMHRAEFRERWAPMGQIAGAQEWQELRKTHFPRVYSELLSKAKLVIIVTHEKAQSDAGVKTGATIPDADTSLRSEAGIVIRIGRNTRDPNSPAPIGLVIKNAGTVDLKKRQIVRLFPDRIAPFNWTRVAEYVTNPIGDREPTAEERPDEFEYHLISGTLNPEQAKIYQWRRKIAAQQIEENLAQDVLDMAEKFSSVTNPILKHTKIVSELQETYPGLTNDRVRDILASTVETALEDTE